MPVLILFAKYDEVAYKRGHVHTDNSWYGGPNASKLGCSCVYTMFF